MWFGDLVTMEWWNDLWLNESFATYASVRCQADATRWTGAWTTFANAEKTWAYAQDQLPSTHPIVAEIADLEAVYVNFDGITYAKGASVLKQLVAYVGDEAFFRACARTSAARVGQHPALRPARRARGGQRPGPRRVVEGVAGDGRTEHAARGPELAEDGSYTSFAVLQEAPADYPTLRPHRIAIGLYEDDSGLDRVRRIELDVTGRAPRCPSSSAAAAGRGRAQRRRPVVREDPLRRALHRAR